MTGDDLERLHSHLEATQERPVERTASRWLGEAEAIAADLAEADLDPTTVQKQLRKVRHLLDNVDGSGDDVADDHVAAARRMVADLLQDSPDRDGSASPDDDSPDGS
jgi:hypothetical protein